MSMFELALSTLSSVLVELPVVVVVVVVEPEEMCCRVERATRMVRPVDRTEAFVIGSLDLLLLLKTKYNFFYTLIFKY